MHMYNTSKSHVGSMLTFPPVSLSLFFLVQSLHCYQSPLMPTQQYERHSSLPPLGVETICHQLHCLQKPPTLYLPSSSPPLPPPLPLRLPLVRPTVSATIVGVVRRRRTKVEWAWLAESASGSQPLLDRRLISLITFSKHKNNIVIIRRGGEPPTHLINCAHSHFKNL